MDNEYNVSQPQYEFIVPKSLGDYLIGLHGCNLTLFVKIDVVREIYDLLLKETFGELQEKPFGLQGYRSVIGDETGFKIAYDNGREDKDWVSMIIPGASCDIMDPKIPALIYQECEKRGIRIHCTRLDIYIDYAPFSPARLCWMVENRLIRRSYVFKDFRMGDDIDDKGNKGTSTLYLGSMHSPRYICIYDKRGYTRFELRYMGDWAEAVLGHYRKNNVEDWPEIFLAHTQDIVEIDDPEWKKFIGGASRARHVLGGKKDVELLRMQKAMIQLMQVYGVLRKVVGTEFWDFLEGAGWEAAKKNYRYKPFIHSHGLEDI